MFLILTRLVSWLGGRGCSLCSTYPNILQHTQRHCLAPAPQHWPNMTQHGAYNGLQHTHPMVWADLALHKMVKLPTLKISRFLANLPKCWNHQIFVFWQIRQNDKNVKYVRNVDNLQNRRDPLKRQRNPSLSSACEENCPWAEGCLWPTGPGWTDWRSSAR